jgi:hypothetical protein
MIHPRGERLLPEPPGAGGQIELCNTAEEYDKLRQHDPEDVAN